MPGSGSYLSAPVVRRPVPRRYASLARRCKMCPLSSFRLFVSPSLRCSNERLHRHALYSTVSLPRLWQRNRISFAAPHLDRALRPSVVSAPARALRRVFPAGLPVSLPRCVTASGCAEGHVGKDTGSATSKRCLAPPSPLYCEGGTIGPWQHCASGKREEAVFSSSEDRTRASQASVAVAGPSIVSRPDFQSPDLLTINFDDLHRPSWATRAAESLFSVLFPSDCRICGEPLLNISRLPVCPDVPRQHSSCSRANLLRLWRARAFVVCGARCRGSAALSGLPPRRPSFQPGGSLWQLRRRATRADSSAEIQRRAPVG